MLVDFRSLTGEFIVLALLAAGVLGLAVYRFLIARHQDFHIHMNMAEAPSVGQQASTATRLLQVDRWGKILTIITAIYAAVLIGQIFYMEWIRRSTQMIVN